MKRWWRWLAGVTAILVVVGFFASVMDEPYLTPLTLCVNDSGAGGARAALRLLKQLGFEAQPWKRQATLPEPDRSTALLLLCDPNSSEYEHRLLDWATEGGHLFLLCASPRELPEDLGRVRLKRLSSVTELRPENLSASSRTPYGTMQTLPYKCRVDVTAEGAFVHGEEERPVIVEAPWGRGTVVAVLDASAVSNAGLDLADNAVVLVRLLQERQVHTIWFYEPPHGHAIDEGWLGVALRFPAARSTLAMLSLLLLLWIVSGNRRFGPAEEPHHEDQRTILEYVDAVAAFYERARAAPLAVEAVVRRLETLLADRMDSKLAAKLTEARRWAELGVRKRWPRDAIRLVSELIQERKQRRWTSPM